MHYFSNFILLSVCSCSSLNFFRGLFQNYLSVHLSPFLSFLPSFLPSFLLSFFLFLWLHLWHMEVPGIGVKSEPQLTTYATAMATLDLSRICGLYHILWQWWIFNPRSEAMNQNLILIDNILGGGGGSLTPWVMTGTPCLHFFSVSHWSFISFLLWSHVFLIICGPCGLFWCLCI